ncbi:MAG: hypothetical protein AABX11_04150 [Nanoarchaeota archaeon]
MPTTQLSADVRTYTKDCFWRELANNQLVVGAGYNLVHRSTNGSYHTLLLGEEEKKINFLVLPIQFYPNICLGNLLVPVDSLSINHRKQNLITSAGSPETGLTSLINSHFVEEKGYSDLLQRWHELSLRWVNKSPLETIPLVG